MSNPYLTRFFATKRRLKIGLVIAGAASGVVVGAALTELGKIMAGAPPATPANYEWNMAVFGLMSAVASPVITWSVLREVPLRRAVLEPVLAGVGGQLSVCFSAQVSHFSSSHLLELPQRLRD